MKQVYIENLELLKLNEMMKVQGGSVTPKWFISKLINEKYDLFQQTGGSRKVF